jgi:2-polyprenyl-3-methyl-5-hydroxy-6-metoxy-1,4-benzoquinol methylase
MNFEEKYFSDIYDSSYDLRNPPYKFRSYFRQVKKYITPSSRVLDVGCAYGSFVKVAKDYCQVSGCDISEHAVAVARKRQPEVDFFVSDILRIPAGPRYDLITCFDIVEHVPQLDEALQHLRSLLKDDGVLCITVPVYDTLVGKLVEKLDKDPTHVHKHARYWWLDKLRANKFKIMSWKGIWRYFLNPYYIHWINPATRSFAPAIIILAKKDDHAATGKRSTPAT